MKQGTVDTMEPIPTQADDSALLRAFLDRNDRQAMGILFARHADAAFRVALRLCRNSADAEDAVQTAFIEVLRHAAKYRGESAVRGWIFGFVVNACRHKAREEGRRAAREERAAGPDEVMPPQRDLQVTVRTAVQGLPEHYRMPVWLHYCEGLSSGEVAEALSLSENTVRSQLSRGVEELRSAMATCGLSVTGAAVVGALATAAVESAPATLTASLSGLASSASPAVAAAKAGLVAKVTSSTVAAAALVTTAAALWWGGIPDDPKPPEFAWIEKRVQEWQPMPEERRFDQVGWVKDLPEALRIAKETGRPVFGLGHVGRINTGRADGGSMAFREGPLASPLVIEMLNTRFVPVYYWTEHPENKTYLRIYHEAAKAKIGMGSEHLLFLEPESGKPVDSMAICHVNLENLLERLDKHARAASGPPVGPIVAHSVAPAPGGLTLHLTARYLDEKGNVLRGKGSYHAFPAEEWLSLSADEEAALVPSPQAPVGTAWEIEKTLADKLLSRFYPLSGNFDFQPKNILFDQAFDAKVVAGRRNVAWIRLDGRVRMNHSFFPTRQEREVSATVAGFVEYDRAEKKVRSLRIVTDQSKYGKENFGVALRSVR